MGEEIAFDHIHLISRDPKAAAHWYQEMFGGEIAAEQPNYAVRRRSMSGSAA